MEIWPLFNFLLPNSLGTERSFDSKYTKHVRTLRASGRRSTKKMRENYILAVEDLHVRVSSMILRRTKNEVSICFFFCFFLFLFLFFVQFFFF